jgi:hypothetical protein
MLVAVVVFVLLSRRVGAGNLEAIGMAPSRDRLRAGLACLAVSFGAVAFLFAVELTLGTRRLGVTLAPRDVVEALVGGVLVGLVEEGLLRGALLFPFGRLRGVALWGANAAISAIYATAHFARGTPPGDGVDWAAVWSMWAVLPGRAADRPEAWLGLFLTGALFYVVAYRQGHAWGAAGLHAGAVIGLQWGGGLTAPVVRDDSLLLVNGLLPGYGVAAVAAVAILVLSLLPAREGSTPRGAG